MTLNRNENEVNVSLKRIEKLDSLLKQLSNHYSEIESEIISKENIFDALNLSLKDKYNWEHPLDFWDLEITYQEAKKILSEFDFRSVLFKIESELDIIPEDLLMKFKVQIKSKGLIWIIHKYDADPFPSNPHAHQTGSGLKLDLSNGKCYKKKTLVTTIKKKDLIIIRNEAEKNFKLPKLKL